MPATQISFAAFASSLLASVQSEATDCTPPAQPMPLMDAGLVTQPGIRGGECIRFDGVFHPFRLVGYGSYRDDFGAYGDAVSGVGLDAPYFVPSGSHVAYEARGLCMADGYGTSRGF